MSIQPNRIVNRIIRQVDQSDWPRLDSEVFFDESGDRWLRIYRTPRHPRYATAIHFWVHALRDELSATGCRSDLVGAACHALCRKENVTQWRAAFSEIDPSPVDSIFAVSEMNSVRETSYSVSEIDSDSEAEVYRMLESECRLSSVLSTRSILIADFWGHGDGPSWRRRV